MAVSWVFFGRAKLLGWGASDEEIARVLPGDDLIADFFISLTFLVVVCGCRRAYAGSRRSGVRLVVRDPAASRSASW